MVGVRDLDELESAFADAAAAQRGGAVLGHHIVDIAAGGDDAGAGGQLGDDARGAVGRGAAQGDDRAAVGAEGRTAQKVGLAAETADELVADGIVDDLAGEVDLLGAGDGDHAAVERDGGRVVDVVAGAEEDLLVAVDVVVEVAGADGVGDDGLAGVLALALVGDGAGLEEFEQGGAEPIGVDTEVLVVAQGGGDGGGGGGGADAQRALVLDEEGDMGGDAFVDLVGGGRGGLGQFGRGLEEGRETVPVDAGLAGGAGQAGIDLGDDERGGVDGGAGDVAGDAERAAAGLVGRGDLDEGEVEGEDTLAEERGDLEGVGGGVVGAAGGERLLDGGAEVEGVGVEVAVVLLLDPGGGAEGEQMDELDVVQFLVLAEQGVDEGERGGGVGAEEDAAAGPDQRGPVVGVQRLRRELAGLRGYGGKKSGEERRGYLWRPCRKMSHTIHSPITIESR